MTNVLIISYGSPTSPTLIENLRVYGLLKDKGLLNMRHVRASKINIEDIKWCDTVLFVRSASTIEYGLIKLFRKLGKFCIYTIDDDLIGLGPDYGNDGEGYWDGRKKVILKTLQQANCFIGVNELLIKKYTELGNIPRQALTYTIIEESEVFRTRQTGKNEDKIRIVLYVNDGTTKMFEQFIRPVLPELCEKYPQKIELYLLTLKPELPELKDKMTVVYVPHMPYKEFKTYLGTVKFDMGLAPLDDEGFSKYKYFNKYVEYTVAGIPSIYSDCRLYKSVIKDGENGVLCKDSKEAWFNAICDLIDNPQKRKDLITKAQDHIYNCFNCDRILDKLIYDVPELVSYKSPLCSQGYRIKLYLFYYNSCEVLFRVSGWVYTVRQYIKQGKIKPLFYRFNRHFIHK